jgi:hypothetical protein
MSRLSLLPRTDHAEAAARLRAHPRMWMRIGRYRSTQSADSAAYQIRTAYSRSTYAPAGTFEARTEADDEGAVLIARYIGAGAR